MLVDAVRAQTLLRENQMLRGIVKVLCAHKNPRGSEAFQYARDHLTPEYRELLMEVLDG